MPQSANDQILYSVSIEGVQIALDARELASEVVAQWLLGESQRALIVASPGQVAKLRELLHVKSVEPVSSGLFTDRSGKWYAVKNSAVMQTGDWVVPQEVLQSVSTSEAALMGSPATAGATPTSEAAPAASATSAHETDPVCGMVMRPGQEAANVNYHGRTYHFCSDECRKLFLSDPGSYV